MNDERQEFASYDEADAYGGGEFRSLLERAVGPAVPDTPRLISGALEHLTQPDPGRRTRVVVLAAAAVAIAVLGTWATVGLLGSDKATPAVDPHELVPTSSHVLAAVGVEHLDLSPTLLLVGSADTASNSEVARVVLRLFVDGEPIDLVLSLEPRPADDLFPDHGLLTDCLGFTAIWGGPCYVRETPAGPVITGIKHFGDHAYRAFAQALRTDTVISAEYAVGNAGPSDGEEATLPIALGVLEAMANDPRMAPRVTRAMLADTRLTDARYSEPEDLPEFTTPDGLAAAVIGHLNGTSVKAVTGSRGGQEQGVRIIITFEHSPARLFVAVQDPTIPMDAWQSHCPEPGSVVACELRPDGSIVETLRVGGELRVTVSRPDGSVISAQSELWQGEPVVPEGVIVGIATDPAIAWTMTGAQIIAGQALMQSGLFRR